MHETYLVPAIYAQWAHWLVDLAKIELGHDMLDVCCGTGVLARAAKLEAGPSGQVTGLDPSEKMLESARRKSEGIDWKQGEVDALPFENNQFDRVMCQFSLMFIPCRIATIKEMLRVCKPDGRVVLAVWAPMNHSKAYCALIDLIKRHAGLRTAWKVSSPWSLGTPGTMDALLLTTGVNEYHCHERVGQARFPSMKSFIDTHLQLVGELENMDADVYQGLLSAADTELHQFLLPNGQLVAKLDANIFILSCD
jgi:ubiquinone/menaquinone biosynthesis C-methylase UbiE